MTKYECKGCGVMVGHPDAVNLHVACGDCARATWSEDSCGIGEGGAVSIFVDQDVVDHRTLAPDANDPVWNFAWRHTEEWAWSWGHGRTFAEVRESWSMFNAANPSKLARIGRVVRMSDGLPVLRRVEIVLDHSADPQQTRVARLVADALAKNGIGREFVVAHPPRLCSRCNLVEVESRRVMCMGCVDRIRVPDFDTLVRALWQSDPRTKTLLRLRAEIPENDGEGMGVAWADAAMARIDRARKVAWETDAEGIKSEAEAMARRIVTAWL